MALSAPFPDLRPAVVFILALLLASCRSPESAVTQGDDDLRVAPVFADFWSSGGGLSTFGPPIASPRRLDGTLRQTFLTVEMIHDPDDRETPVRLAPLGWELGLAEPPVPPLEGQTSDYFPATGHTLYAGFAQLFDDLGGEAVAGAPITEVAFRDGRIIQYFENLGLTRPENASPADTRLVALGLAAHPTSPGFGVDPQVPNLGERVRERPFARFLEPLGGEARFGQPLSDPYIAGDGAVEQIYERAVIYSPDGSVRQAAFRPIGAGLGPPADPVPATEEDGSLYFDETGHNVAWAFADFYRRESGEVVLGLPLEEAVLEANGMRQRFENGILMYLFDLPPDLSVQLAALGRAYLAEHPPPTAEPTLAPSVEEPPADEASATGAVHVRAELDSAIILPGESQVLRVFVTREDGTPVEGSDVILRIVGRTADRRESLPETDSEGATEFTWRDSDPVPGEIVTLIVRAAAGGQAGETFVQYAHGFAPVASPPPQP